MGYRKWTADAIFDGDVLHRNKALIINDYNKVEALVDKDAATDAVYHRGILTPGFINCHCHLELSHMKGLIPLHTGLVDFVFNVVTQRHFGEEEIKEAIAQGEEEMWKNGIVAVGDICNNALTLSQKQKGRLRYYNFIEASGWLPAVATTRFEKALQLYREFESTKQFKNSMVPHAPYSVSQELWEELTPYFQNKVVSIHNQETSHENEFFKKGAGDLIRMYELMKMDNSHHRPTGKTSLQSYFHRLRDASKLIFVHNTFTAQEDIDFIFHQTATVNRIYFCLCVNANLYIEKALPPVSLLRDHHCSIVLGTDSLASNPTLSIADEMKTIRKNFPFIPLEEILRWATRNGARALEMENRLGSFEKGKEPGVLVLDPHNLEVQRLI